MSAIHREYCNVVTVCAQIPVKTLQIVEIVAGIVHHLHGANLGPADVHQDIPMFSIPALLQQTVI